jgi:hypothetical protein
LCALALVVNQFAASLRLQSTRITKMLRAMWTKYTVVCELLLALVRLDNRGTVGAGQDACVLSLPKIL